MMIYRAITWERDQAEKAVIEAARQYAKGLIVDIRSAVDRLAEVTKKEEATNGSHSLL